MEERVWDYSTLDTFQTCRKKYYWWYVRGLNAKTKSMALIFGQNIHDALDVFYRGEGIDKAIQLYEATHVDREGDDLRTVANGKKLLEWYGRLYQNEPFKPLMKPESGFVFHLTDDILYGGRMDLLADWNGQMWVVEHKTTSKLGSMFFRQFDLDKQPTGYIMAAEAFSKRECQGCLINAVQPWKDVKRVSAKTKRPEEHFVRAPLTKTKEQKERFRLNVARIVRDILWCEENNEFYEAEKKDVCFSYNYDCPYKELCRFGENEKVIAREYVVERWEPYKLAQVEKKVEEVKDGERDKQ